MKISTLIERLDSLRNKHGDVEVVLADGVGSEFRKPVGAAVSSTIVPDPTDPDRRALTGERLRKNGGVGSVELFPSKRHGTPREVVKDVGVIDAIELKREGTFETEPRQLDERRND